MKIVHVTETLVSGVQAYLRNLAAFLNENAPDAEVYIIYSGLREEFDKAGAEKLFKGKAVLIEVPMLRKVAPVRDIKSTIAIYRQLKKINPDVIHLHSSKAGILGRVAAFFYRKKKKKLFYTPHGYAFLRQDVSRASQTFFKLVEKNAQFFLGGTTIACGDTEYEIARGFGKAVLVRNGITFNGTATECPPATNQTLTMGIVSRNTPQRVPGLFNAIALHFPDVNFVWIGDGDKNVLTAPNITITGWLFNQEEVHNHMCRLDVYLHTSLWEGLPYAILEAMAQKKPVIATNVIGNKDAVVHGETGFLFNEPQELEPYIALLKDPAARTEMGLKGYNRCVEEFNNSKSFTQLLGYYRA